MGTDERQRQRVAYGLIKTRLTVATNDAGATANIEGREIKVGVNPGLMDAMEKMIPLGRGGTPDEAAGAVYLFCIPESDYVSGQTLAVQRRVDRHLSEGVPMAMVLSERDGAVALLTLNNPAQYNALGAQLLSEFNGALEEAIANPEVRVILLTGAGKGFCSGAQFGGDTFSQGEAIGTLMRQSVNPLIERLRQSPTPVVTAVNGAAAGAGVGVALAGDVVLAARSARFILSFARLGAVLDGGTSQFLQRCIGAARARCGADRRSAHCADGGRLGPGLAVRRRRAAAGRSAHDGAPTGRRRAAGAGDDQAAARRRLGRRPGRHAGGRGRRAEPRLRHAGPEGRRERLRREARAAFCRALSPICDRTSRRLGRLGALRPLDWMSARRPQGLPLANCCLSWLAAFHRPVAVKNTYSVGSSVIVPCSATVGRSGARGGNSPNPMNSLSPCLY